MRKFNKDELFCRKCFTHDTFFTGGGATASNNCPECSGTDCVLYENLTSLQRSKARDKFVFMQDNKITNK